MWITFTVNQRKPINSIQILLLLLWNDFNFWCQYGQYIIQDLRLNLSAQLGKDFTGLVFVLLFDSFLETNLRNPPWSLFWKNASYDIRLVAQWLALHSKPVFWDGFLLAYTMWCWNSCWVGSALSFPVGYSSNSNKEAPFCIWILVWGVAQTFRECSNITWSSQGQGGSHQRDHKGGRGRAKNWPNWGCS